MASDPRATGVSAPRHVDDAEMQRLELMAKFFRGLTDLTRLRIVETLLDAGECNVSQLVERIGQSQGRISTHLACLRWCGYVTTRREGKYIYYRVADERVASLVLLARGIIADHANAILTCTRM